MQLISYYIYTFLWAGGRGVRGRGGEWVGWWWTRGEVSKNRNLDSDRLFTILASIIMKQH
jgi:hypothetical protein